MEKIVCFFNRRQHYNNRLIKRGGKHWMFLLARKIDKKGVADLKRKSPCHVWRYKNYIWLTQGWKLQTFVNKNI